LGVAAAAVMLLAPPITHAPASHPFADQRRMLGIPNLLDVISNLPLAVVGVLGLLFVGRRKEPFTGSWERAAFAVMFAGVGLTALGSTYYHLAPDNATLFWDRVPMTIVFMSLFASVIGDRIGPEAGRRLLLPLLAAGIASVVYWRWTGDLKFYGLVQYFPMLAILLMVLLLPRAYTGTVWLGGAVCWYALAKIFEMLDAQIFALGQVVSGHTLKHLAAGAATWWLLGMMKVRRRTQAGMPVPHAPL
jgi:hypothetical protein